MLKGKSRFDRLFSGGKWFNGREIGVRVTSISGNELKLAVCISRKTAARAVDRNRLKRVTRVALDPYIERMRTGYYVAFFPRRGFEALTGAERSRSVGALIKRAGLFANPGVVQS